MRTSFSPFSLFSASMACISFIDSSTFPCSPAQTQHSQLTKRHKRHTECLDLFRSSLNCQLNFSNFTHLHARDFVSLLISCEKGSNILTRLVVFAFSSGVFSRRLCAVRIRRSHSSTKAKMLFSYSVWNLANIGSLGLASRAVRNSVFNRSVCDLGHAPRSIF